MLRLIQEGGISGEDFYHRENFEERKIEEDYIYEDILNYLLVKINNLFAAEVMYINRLQTVIWQTTSRT